MKPKDQVLLFAVLMVLVLGIYSIILGEKIKALKSGQEVLTEEVKNLQHDTKMLMSENLILYLRGERFNSWYDSVLNREAPDIKGVDP